MDDSRASLARPDIANPELVYLDSNFYLDVLRGDEQRYATLRHILEAWRRGEVRVVTSALTIAEVLNLRRRAGLTRLRLPPEREPQIDELFNHRDMNRILIVDVTRQLAAESRQLVWGHGIEPRDAIHICTALLAKVPVMFTSDQELWSKDVGGDPPLSIEEPRWNVQAALFHGK